MTDSKQQTCVHCGGSGEGLACPYCRGTGVAEQVCQQCGGSGTIGTSPCLCQYPVAAPAPAPPAGERRKGERRTHPRNRECTCLRKTYKDTPDHCCYVDERVADRRAPAATAPAGDETREWLRARMAGQEIRLAELERRVAELRRFVQAFNDFAPECAQLLDGWHQDGTAWSEWDEGVRANLTGLMKAAAALEKESQS